LSKVSLTEHIIGHTGTVLRVKEPMNNVKALKVDRVLRIRLQSHQVQPTVLQYYDTYAVTKQNMHTHKHK